MSTSDIHAAGASGAGGQPPAGEWSDAAGAAEPGGDQPAGDRAAAVDAVGDPASGDPTRALADAAPLHRPWLGADGEPCAGCGAPLASDQRYCLQCGVRRAAARVPFLDILPAPPKPARPAATAPTERERRPLPAGAAAAVAAALLGMGVLAGAIVAGDEAPVVTPPAAKAPVVNVTNAGAPAPGGAAPGAAASPAPAAFTPDWPDGKEGWTIQLRTLPKDGTTPDAVAAAKSDAQGKGAADVGALDSDAFPSLDAGAYVIYSGVFDDRKAAQRALGDVREGFPDAKIVQVGAAGGDDAGGDAETKSPEELERKKKLTPEEAQKETRKAPSKQRSEGKAPPSDDKPARGGQGVTIG